MSSAVVGRPRRVVAERTEVTIVLLRYGAELVSWSLAVGGPADLALVEELARLQLAARRMGCTIRLRDAGADLRGLLDLVGLDAVVGGSVVEVGREAEESEQVGVEEAVLPDDPVA